MDFDDVMYEEEFEFPLFKLVREKAEELDISYHDALVIVKPEYVRTIRYGDTEFEEKTIADFEKLTEQTNENWKKFVEERRKIEAAAKAQETEEDK